MIPIIRKSYLLISLLLAFVTTANAQQSATPPIVPIVPLEPRVENPDEVVGLIVLSDETALQVLDMLEKMTGKIILRRQDIAAVKINFNSRGELTKGEAVLALESLLSLNAIMLTDMGGRFMKAVPATSVNSHVPEMIVGSTLGLPASQQIYAKLFKFDYLQAEATSGTTVTPLLSQNSSVIVFPKSNAMLITDALINLQRIERIIDEMDKPQEIREEIQFIKLDYIQASEMQQRIENLISGALKNYLEGTTSVTADERTNQLILITHPGNLEVIKNVIDSVDVDAAPLTSSEVFPLRQAKAEEVVAIIDEIISGQKEGREEDAKVAKDNKKTDKMADTTNLPNAKPNAAASANTTSSNASNSSLQFSNFVGLSADERTNSIVAYGTHSDLKTLKDLIDKIDIPLPQVRIEAIITEVSLNDDQAQGISSFGFTYDNNSEGPTLTFGSSITDDKGSIIQAVGGIFGSGFAFTGNSEGLLNSVLRSSESDSDIRILSTPTIVVSHNEEGIVNISESVPIITSSTSSLNSNNNSRSTVEFKDIGIQLTVTPLIGADGSVQMSIEQTVDNIAGTTEIDGNDQPIIGRREASSTITVNSNDVIILGGLQENGRSDSNSYFPLIGRLPIINKLFGTSSTQYDRKELIIFIRPTVLKTPDEIRSITQEKVLSIKGGAAVQAYIDNKTIGDTYIEDSKLMQKLHEEKMEKAALKEIEEREPKKRSFLWFW